MLFARQRSSHQTSLNQYLPQLVPVKDPIYSSCRLEEQDLTRWLCDCPTGGAIKQHVFGCHKGSLEWITPWGYDGYARKALVTLNDPSRIRLAVIMDL